VNPQLLIREKYHKFFLFSTDFMVASIAMAIYLGHSISTTLYAINHPDPNLTIVAYCKIRFYLNQWCSMTYRWCLSMACIDRYALSSTNIRLRNFSKVNIARGVAAGIVIIWLLIPIYTLVYYNLRSGSCGILYDDGVALFHSLFTTITGAFLPMTIMITCAVLIHRNLVLKRERRQLNVRQSTQERDESQNLQRKRDRQVLVMLLTQAIFYVIVTAPLMVFYVYQAASFFIKNTSADSLAVNRFLQFVSILIQMIFPVSSFYLYSMVSHTFREAFVSLLRSSTGCRWFVHNNRIEPTANGSVLRRTIQNEVIGTAVTNQPIQMETF
jgi:hypothetical protein